jgi:hypothetical protein
LIRSAVRLAGNLLATATFVLAAACDPRLDVNATGNVPTGFSRVLVTVKEVWINESAAATPDDTTWQKFDLDDSITIDLVNLTGGELAELARNLDVAAGTYGQIRVLLASADDDLLDSAEDAGATYNNEVAWVDEDGVARLSPLEVLNADQGVGIETQFRVKEEEVDSTVVHVVFDAARDLTEFRYSDEIGFLLNPTLRAFDAADAGTISGTLNMSLVTGGIGVGRPAIQVTAQRLNTTQGRREIIASAPVSRSGAFILYPLPLDEGDEDDTEFDLVIHGPAIETIVLRDVPVSEGTPAEASSIRADITLQPATSFEVELEEETPVAPRGASIAFYQTPPDEDVPYLIELMPVDPLRGLFSRPLRLSRSSTITYGDYEDTDLRSNAPEEGAEHYAVAAFSPHFGEGALSGTLLRPASTASEVATFSVPVPAMPAGAVTGTVSVTVTVENPGRYDRGVLLVTREGSVLNAIRLDDLLQQAVGSAFVDVSAIPAGSAATTFDRALYYLEAWTWDSDDPEDSFERHPGSVVDLRTTDTAAGTITIR